MQKIGDRLYTTISSDSLYNERYEEPSNHWLNGWYRILCQLRKHANGEQGKPGSQAFGREATASAAARADG